MDGYFINYIQIDEPAKDLQTIEAALDRYPARLIQILNSMDMKLSGVSNIKKTIQSRSVDIATIYSHMDLLRSLLTSDIVPEYLNAEQSFLDVISGLNFTIEDENAENEAAVLYVRQNMGGEFTQFNAFEEFSKDHLSGFGLFLQSLNLGGLDIVDALYTLYGANWAKIYLAQILAQDVGQKTIDTSFNDDVKRIIEFITDGKTINDIKKFVDLTDKEKEYLKVLDFIGTAVDWTKVGEKVLYDVLQDFSKNVAVLDALQKNVTDPKLLDAVNQLKDQYTADYSSRFVTAVTEIGGVQLAKDGFKAVLDTPYMGAAKIELFAINLIQKLTGLDNGATNFKELNGIIMVEPSANAAYIKQCEIINSGNYTQADLTNCQELFNFMKSAKLAEYNAMLKMTNNPAEKAMLQNGINKLNAMEFAAPNDGNFTGGGGSLTGGGNGGGGGGSLTGEGGGGGGGVW